MDQDLIKKKIVYHRSDATTYTSAPVEFPIGLNEAVSLIAIHWHLEGCKNGSGDGLYIAALSENPNHELAPPTGVAEFEGNLDLYGMATWYQFSTFGGTDFGWAVNNHCLIIPLYGILRPKRQIAVFANIWHTGITGIRGEIYYKEDKPSREVVDAISRRSGKYRRT